VTSAQRRKGTGFELDVVRFLRGFFHFAERAYGAGRPDDRGDIAGIPDWTLELKNHKEFDLAGWCAEAAAESVNARTRWWAVIAKRRNRPVSDAYVVMPLEQFARLLSSELYSKGWDDAVRFHTGIGSLKAPYEMITGDDGPAA
jgi:hypothetical protein